MLAYEEAMTRDLPLPDSVSIPPSDSRAHYNTSAHFLWIGDRTRQLTGAHVEYFRGVRNPIGIKVGPSMAVDELVDLLNSESVSFFLSFLQPPRHLRILPPNIFFFFFH